MTPAKKRATLGIARCTALRAAALPLLLLAAGACAGGPRMLDRLPDPDLRAAERADPTGFLGDVRSPDPAERLAAARALARLGGDGGPSADLAADVASLLLADPDPEVRAAAFFAVGVTGSPKAAGLIERHAATATRADAAAAARGLANCGDEHAARVLLAIALRPDHPPEAVEALFCHVRWGGKPLGAKLPDAGLLAFAGHAEPAGRAALGHLARACKDPALLPALESLAADPDFEVRRAAALGLGNGRDAAARGTADVSRVLAALASASRDADPRVVAAACRALGTYDDPRTVEMLLSVASVASDAAGDFNRRVAAIEALGARKAASAADLLADTARADGSASVRFAAATELAKIDAKRARPLADLLLADPSVYVRCAGVDVVAAAKDPADDALLAQIAATDPHVRVRGNAVGAFEERKSDAARAAVVAALGDPDPGIAGTAAAVAGKNGFADMADAIAALLPRHPGTEGADARESACSALGELKSSAHAALLASVASDDPDVAVRDAARKSADVLAGREASKSVERLPASIPYGARAVAAPVSLVLETTRGTMTIELYPGLAPVHVAHVVDCARRGVYDGLTWHRVVPDFVIQGGCPRGDGSGNAGATIPLEPTPVPFERGTLGMPRSNHPDTGGCQLFICHSRAPHLDVKYTAFGRVTEGLDVIDRIDVDDRILRATVRAGSGGTGR